MPTITIFKFDKELEKEDTINKLNFKNDSELFSARLSKFNNNEIFVVYSYYEDIKDILKKSLNEENDFEQNRIAEILEKNGIKNVLRKKYVFLNIKNKTVEIYSAEKRIIEKIKKVLKERLGIELIEFNFIRKKIKPEIKFLQGKPYSVEIYKNRIKFSKNKDFLWKPRYDIRQIVNYAITNCG